jgi:hypothetical protein
LAMLATMRCASSHVSSLAGCPPTLLVIEIDVGERPAVVVADDEALPIQLWIGLLSEPRRREAARGRNASVMTRMGFPVVTRGVTRAGLIELCILI